MIQGNEFRLIIPAKNEMGEEVVISSSYLYNSNGTKKNIILTKEVQRLYTDIDADLTTDKYGVEIIGTKNGKRFRRYIAEAFEITMDGEDDFEYEDDLPLVTTKIISI